jgi:hypothetical protein
VVTAGPVFWAADDTADVLRFYRDLVSGAPDEFGTVVRLGTVREAVSGAHWRASRPAIRPSGADVRCRT